MTKISLVENVISLNNQAG